MIARGSSLWYSQMRSYISKKRRLTPIGSHSGNSDHYATEERMNTMLILRGNPGDWKNEEGKVIHYPRGALHERAALVYAKLRGYAGKVLDVAGWPSEKSAQTVMALAEFRRDPTVAAFYGFSGG